MRDLSLHLMDILQNSISAGASQIQVAIMANGDSDQLSIQVKDNGKGMEGVLLKHVADPFATTRTTRKVGLGIPLFKASAEQAGGTLKVESAKGIGTTVEAGFKISHIDRLPLGDMAETVIGTICSKPEVDLELTLCCKGKPFVFRTAEVKKQLKGVPIIEYEVLNWIKEYIREGINITFGGVLNEINC